MCSNKKKGSQWKNWVTFYLGHYTGHLFPSYLWKSERPKKLASYKGTKKGDITTNVKRKLTSYTRQKRASWETEFWEMQAINVIDVVLQRAECISEQWLVSWFCQEGCWSLARLNPEEMLFFEEQGTASTVRASAVCTGYPVIAVKINHCCTLYAW